MKNTAKIGIFPGSFDPFTKGHEAMVEKALMLFDEIIIAIGVNSSKQYLFSLEERTKHLEVLYQNNSKVKVQHYEGLTVEFAKSVGACAIVRGLRDVKDFEYEKSIALMNRELMPAVETVFLVTEAKYMAINSVIVRDIIKNGGDVSQFVPSKIHDLIQ